MIMGSTNQASESNRWLSEEPLGLQWKRRLYPGQIGANIDVDPGHVSLPAANAPGDKADHIPEPIAGADEGRAAIARARILARFAAGADEADGVECKGRPEARGLQCRLAIGIRY